MRYDQHDMEEKVKAFIDKINENEKDAILGMLKPCFVECSAEEQTLNMAYPAMEWERNPLGIMQGGIVAAILDFSVACLAVYYCGDAPVTVSFQVSYLRPAPLKGNLMVKVRATKVGKSILHAFVECWPEDAPGKLCATANGAYIAP